MPLFDIFGSRASTITPGSIFTGAPRQIREPVVAERTATMGNAIVNALSRIPLWFTGLVGGVLNPVVDVSFQYPLQWVIDTEQSADSVNPNDNMLTVFRPPAGKVWYIPYMNVSCNAAGGSVQHFLDLRSDSNLINTVRIHTVGGGVNFPGIFNAIGGATNIAQASSAVPNYLNVNIVSIRPLYLTNSVFLQGTLLANAGGQHARYDFIRLEFPENQPMGHLLATL